MTIAHLLRTVQDQQTGELLLGAQVTLCSPGTETPISDLLFSDAGLTQQLSNPFTSSNGLIDVYLGRPMTVLVRTSYGSAVTLDDYVSVMPLAENLLVSPTPMTITNSPGTGLVLMGDDSESASWSLPDEALVVDQIARDAAGAAQTTATTSVNEAPLAPQRFGDVGLGGTDTTALQAWLDALATGNKAEGYLPSGLYNSGPLTYSGNYAEIKGARATTIKLIDGANAPLLATPNDSTQRNGLRLIGFTLDGNAANQTGSSPLLDIYGMNDFFMERMYVANPRGAGLRMGAAGTKSCLNPFIARTLFRGDQVNTLGAAVELDSKSSDAHISDLDIGWFVNDAGVLLSGHFGAQVQHTMVWQCKWGFHNFAAHRIRFTACLADFSKSHGFFMQNSNDLQFSTCQGRESGQLGINTADGFFFQGASVGSPATDIVMIGNRAMGAWQRYGINFAGNLARANAFASALSGNNTGPSNNDASNVSCSIA